VHYNNSPRRASLLFPRVSSLLNVSFHARIQYTSNEANISLTFSIYSSNPPGFAFILYKYGEDADSAVRSKFDRKRMNIVIVVQSVIFSFFLRHGWPVRNGIQANGQQMIVDVFFKFQVFSADNVYVSNTLKLGQQIPDLGHHTVAIVVASKSLIFFMQIFQYVSIVLAMNHMTDEMTIEGNY
jgi:hypothetical protein